MQHKPFFLNDAERKEWGSLSLPQSVIQYWELNEWLRPAIPELTSAEGKLLICVQFSLRLNGYGEISRSIINPKLNPFLSAYSPSDKVTEKLPRIAYLHWALISTVKSAFSLDTREGVIGLREWYFQHALASLCVPEKLEPELIDPEKIKPYLREELNLGPNDIAKTIDLIGKNSHAVVDTETPIKNPHNLLVLGYSSMTSGVGELARQTYESLKTVGLNPGLCDVGINPDVHKDAKNSTVAIPLDRLDQPSEVHLFAGAASELFNHSLRSKSKVLGKRYTIGFFPWELDTWPKNLAFCLDLVDELWAISEHCAKAFRASVKKPVFVMPSATQIPAFQPKKKADFGLNPEAFTYFFMYDPFSYVERKNPFAAIKAFKEAFPTGNEKTALVIKSLRTSSLEKIKEVIGDDTRISIITKKFDRDELFSFFSVMDCFVSLHRAEGFGLSIAEAMFMGIPTIVTNYSGNVDFCNNQNSYLVDYKLVPVKPGEYPFSEGAHWAEVKIDSAIDKFRDVFTDRVRRDEIVKNAKSLMTEKYTVTAVGKAYATRLNELRTQLGLPG
ncbi:MAG: glycosyltransferase family 4 protein [Bdellovibrionales bacterium]|nr:glycosyltransferase family 4 protein [Bdellovibrionales bacterium]